MFDCNASQSLFDILTQDTRNTTLINTKSSQQTEEAQRTEVRASRLLRPSGNSPPWPQDSKASHRNPTPL